jgi:hypothetical protein
VEPLLERLAELTKTVQDNSAAIAQAEQTSAVELDAEVKKRRALEEETAAKLAALQAELQKKEAELQEYVQSFIPL